MPSPILILGVLCAVLTLGIGVTSKWAMHESEVAAKAEASAAQWESIALTCSESVDTADKAAKKAQKQAQDALKQARAANASSEAQKRALDDSKGKGLTCEGAVTKVRDGLR